MAVVVSPGSMLASAPDTASSAVQASISFRAQMGLRADLTYVQSMEADKTKSRAYGIALDPAEKAEIDRRVAIQTQLPPLSQALQQDDHFAGLSMDQPAGGVIDIATTGDLSAMTGLAEPYVPSGATVKFRQVQYSSRYLSALQAQVDGEYAKVVSPDLV